MSDTQCFSRSGLPGGFGKLLATVSVTVEHSLIPGAQSFAPSPCRAVSSNFLDVAGVSFLHRGAQKESGRLFKRSMVRSAPTDEHNCNAQKGNVNTKYNRILDGISIGEVGFPTLIYHAGLKFDILNRNDYFVNEWNG